MRNHAIKAVLVTICLISFSAYAREHPDLRLYIKKNFPPKFQVSAEQISQLEWAFQHNRHTKDLDLWVKNQDVYVEVSRALTRLYCAQLLRSGSRNDYNQFVNAQLESAGTSTLSLASFTKLSQHVQSLSAADYSLLETATILTAVSLSKPAEELARQAMDVAPVINDNIGFLAATLRNGVNIYPLTAHITQDNTAARKLLYVLFPPQTNFRHMLYTEGGVSMYKYLRSMIAHKFIDKSSLDLWYAHWIINVAGFRGHIDQRGSIYLNEDVAQAMLTLKGLVYELLEQPNFEPLIPYLSYRAKIIGFNNLQTEQKLFYTNIACLMRIYNVDGGQKLYAALQKIPSHKLTTLKKHFFSGLREPQQITHIYLPAFFGNALKFTNGDIDKVVTQLLPVYDAILQQATRQHVTTTLSFNQLSATENVVQLLHKSSEQQQFRILKDGTVAMN